MVCRQARRSAALINIAPLPFGFVKLGTGTQAAPHTIDTIKCTDNMKHADTFDTIKNIENTNRIDS